MATIQRARVHERIAAFEPSQAGLLLRPIDDEPVRQTKSECGRRYFPDFSWARRSARPSREACASFLHALASMKASGLPPLSRAFSRSSVPEKPGCGVRRMSQGTVSKVVK